MFTEAKTTFLSPEYSWHQAMQETTASLNFRRSLGRRKKRKLPDLKSDASYTRYLHTTYKPMTLPVFSITEMDPAPTDIYIKCHWFPHKEALKGSVLFPVACNAIKFRPHSAKNSHVLKRSQAKLVVASSRAMQLLSHTISVDLSAHDSWHCFDRQCLAHHSLAYTSDHFLWKQKIG